MGIHLWHTYSVGKSHDARHGNLYPISLELFLSIAQRLITTDKTSSVICPTFADQNSGSPIVAEAELDEFTPSLNFIFACDLVANEQRS